MKFETLVDILCNLLYTPPGGPLAVLTEIAYFN